MIAEQHVVMYKAGETGDIWAVTYLLDLTEKHKAEAANKANEAKTEFVSRAAHDIRTPMNSLFGFLQIAEANIHDTDKLEYCLKKIRVAGEFLKELVNDVLDISKMENGKLTLNKKEISVKELFEELPTLMQGADFGKKIDFNCNVHGILCDTAKDGEECVEKFKHASGADYDAILLDIQMPNVNGIDAAKRIRGLNFERANDSDYRHDRKCTKYRCRKEH